MALLTLAVYLLASVLAYDFLEVLIEGTNQERSEEAQIDLDSTAARLVLAGQALIWPYYLVRSRILSYTTRKGE